MSDPASTAVRSTGLLEELEADLAFAEEAVTRAIVDGDEEWISAAWDRRAELYQRIESERGHSSNDGTQRQAGSGA